MAEGDSPPFFSVIIPTRNRPALLRQAMESALAQRSTSAEIIVIVDGSDDRHLRAYRELEALFHDATFHYLEHREYGHGQSYSMNVGAHLARGRYLCFIDDDDCWTDDNYLQRARSSIEQSADIIDVHYSNQKAFHADGTLEEDALWLEDLIAQVDGSQLHVNGTYRIDAAFIMRSAGFAHLNCSIFRSGFYHEIGGMDETIRYENDREMFIRSVDRARHMLFSTHHVSRHNIPDAGKRENMSTVASAIEKKLFQLRVYDKGICLSSDPSVVAHCRRGKTYELKHITEMLAGNGHSRVAAYYAREALLNGFNLRWLAYTAYLGLKALFR
ncbi:MAG: glycosyltransferase family A protein [Halioglobus sp.]|nr:glycosyltransferase family A protein [Halioglobus sp.]